MCIDSSRGPLNAGRVAEVDLTDGLGHIKFGSKACQGSAASIAKP